MAERMRKSVHDLLIPHLKSPIGHVVTISAGVSASNGRRASADVIAEADKALYRAKMSGRNRVETVTGTETPRGTRLVVLA
jgi:diguanylate cyclase (GGDEF)-like protein